MTKPRLKIELVTTSERRRRPRWVIPVLIAALFALFGFLFGNVMATANAAPSSTTGRARVSTSSGSASEPALQLGLPNSGQLRATRILLNAEGNGRVVVAADPKGQPARGRPGHTATSENQP